jgi:hypothetical protein
MKNIITKFDSFINEGFFGKSKKEKEQEENRKKEENREIEIEQDKLETLEKKYPINEIINQLINNKIIDVIKPDKDYISYQPTYKVKIPFGNIIIDVEFPERSGDIIYNQSNSFIRTKNNGTFRISTKTTNIIYEILEDFLINKKEVIKDEFDF